MSVDGLPRGVNFRPLRLLTALRVAIAALLLAFGVVLFLSFGKKEEQAVKIRLSPPAPAAGAEVVDLSDAFFISGTRGGRDSFRLQADQVTGIVGDKKILKGVRLEVFGEGGDHLSLRGEDGQFDIADKKASLAGHVEVEGKDGFRVSAPQLYFDGDRDMIFTSEEVTFASRGVSGRGRGLNYLTRNRTFKIPADVRVTVTDPGEADPLTITSADMTLGLEDNAVVFNESVRMVHGDQTFTGNYMKVTLDSSRQRVTTVKAYGQVTARVLSGPEDEPAALETDSLFATLAPDGRTLERVEAHGNSRVTTGTYQGTGETLEADLVADRVALRGEPVVTDPRSRIAAREIDLFPSAKGLEARGDVKTTFSPGEKGKGGPGFFSGPEPIYFQSGRLSVEDSGAVARYSGSARGWQGENSLQAEEIVLRSSDRTLRAYRNVLCRFTPAGEDPAAGGGTAGAAGGTPSLVMASAMEFAEAEGVAHFRDGVKMSRPDSTLASERMHVTMAESETGRRRATEFLAEGAVRFTHLSHTGACDRLRFRPDENLAEMQQSAGLAEVMDRTTGRTLRGKTLTYDLKGRRVLTETSEGGRTWITLNPKEKDPAGLEPKIGH